MALAQVTLVCKVPSFKYTRVKEDWPAAIFTPLLMRHGTPPEGIKFYGQQQRLHVRGADARKWMDKIAADCKKAVEDASCLSHYKPYWRENHALHIKNEFIEWIKENRA